MKVKAVHWHEGMFFWPHHMQQAERFQFQQRVRSHKWNVHHNWGIRRITWDEDALTNGRLVIQSLQARLRDGTEISVPEDGSLPPLDFKAALENQSSIKILLAVPQLQVGHRNTLDGANPQDTASEEDNKDMRFFLDSQEIQDENTGNNAQVIQVRRYNLKLHLETQATGGYEVLPLVQVRKSSTPEALPEVDTSFIPPLLGCDAWKPLQAGILQAIYDLLGAGMDRLAGEVSTRNISFDTRHYGAPRRLAQLQVVNQGVAVLHNIAFIEGIHPLTAYVELCRLVGQLAIFGDTKRVPEIPLYDHDDLAVCFFRLKQYIDSLLDLGPPTYQERPFQGKGLRLQVALEPEWLQPKWIMFVGVRSPLESSECIRLLTKMGELNMKIGSADKVDEIFVRGAMGLKFDHCSPADLPQSLPVLPDLIYFQVSRESQQKEWTNVEASQTLAIRLNRPRIVGEIEGQQDLTIKTGKTGNQTTTMQFILYLVAEEL